MFADKLIFLATAGVYNDVEADVMRAIFNGNQKFSSQIAISVFAVNGMLLYLTVHCTKLLLLSAHPYLGSPQLVICAFHILAKLYAGCPSCGSPISRLLQHTGIQWLYSNHGTPGIRTLYAVLHIVTILWIKQDLIDSSNLHADIFFFLSSSSGFSPDLRWVAGAFLSTLFFPRFLHSDALFRQNIGTLSLFSLLSFLSLMAYSFIFFTRNACD